MIMQNCLCRHLMREIQMNLFDITIVVVVISEFHNKRRNVMSHNHYHPSIIINSSLVKRINRTNMAEIILECKSPPSFRQNGNDLIILPYICCAIVVAFIVTHSLSPIRDHHIFVRCTDTLDWRFRFEMIIKLHERFSHVCHSNFAPDTILLSQFTVFITVIHV